MRRVLDQGFVHVVDHMGSDLSVVNAARISFGKRKAEFDEKDAALIAYLAEHEHTAPFRHAFVTFHIKAPIFVLRQWMKHTVGCVTGDSLVRFERTPGTRVREGFSEVPIETLYEWWTKGRPHKWFKSGRQDFKKVLQSRAVRSLDEATGTFVNNFIQDIVFQGIKPVYKVTTEDGYTVTLTSDHKLWTESGWKPLNDCVNSVENFSVAYRKIAVNGVRAVGNGKYQNKDYLIESYARGLTLDQIAEECQCSVETIKKWYYRHGVAFNKRSTTFKTGHKPWNKGKTYSLPNANHSNHIGRRGANSNFWRGGTTTERRRITAWTTQMAPLVHKAFNYQCAKCGNYGGTLQVHHRVPVSVNPDLAYCFDNLVSVCKKCHRDIHRSPEAEAAFAELPEDSFYAPRKVAQVKATERKLIQKFERIIAVVPCGEQKVYDLVMRNPQNPSFVANGVVVHNCSWNELSGRYTEFESEFYLPDEFRLQAMDNKQGSCGCLGATDNTITKLKLKAGYEAAYRIYKDMIAQGVCREQARMILPLATYSEVYWTASLQAIAHFIHLRLDAHAQQEIREYAAAVKEQAQNLFPEAIRAMFPEGSHV